jgi:hypothetical protein
MSKEQAIKEIEEMVSEYHRQGFTYSGFLTGSSLCGNKGGDSARYWELNKIIDD